MKSNQNQIKSNQIKSNQVKSNENKQQKNEQTVRMVEIENKIKILNPNRKNKELIFWNESQDLASRTHAQTL